MKISILTATYNRAHLLPALYQSMLENIKIYDNVEWLIMDDGSKDDTESLIQTWINEGIIDLHYYKQENAGKMAAINQLGQYVTGDIWIEMDSDDVFHPGIFKKIAEDYQALPETAYGILYYKHLEGMEVQRDETLENKILRLYDMHYKYGYSYDMALTFKASIRRQFVYPLEHGERFVTEARMYYQMDQQHDGLWIKNDVLMTCDYMEDGYTKHILEIFKKYPYGYYEYFKELLNYPHQEILFKKKYYMIKHYILFSILTKRSYKEARRALQKRSDRRWFSLLYIPGYLVTKIKLA